MTRKWIKKYYHKIYYTTRDGTYFGYLMMVFECLRGFFEGVIMSIIPIYATQEMVFGSDGYSSDMWTLSFIVYLTVIIANNIVCLLRANQITLLLVGVWSVFSLLPFFAFAFLYDSDTFSDMNISQGSWGFLINQGQFILSNFFF